MKLKNVPIETLTITRSAREGQDSIINLAEAYAYRSPTSSEAPILSSLQTMYDSSLDISAQELERRFVKDLLRLSGQSIVMGTEPFVLFSASESISIVAKILAQRRMSCAVLEPTLDIIPRLFRSAGVSVVPYSESLLLDRPSVLVSQIDADAIYLALPNNPTGLFLDRPSFERLARACKRTGKTIIIDASFRALELRSCFDYYEVLDKAGADYLVIEDTGKLWATNGIKAGVLIASKNYASEAKCFFDDLILTISPFTLMLLWRLAGIAGVEAVQEIRQCIKDSRATVYDALKDSRVFAVSEGSRVSIEQIYYDESVFGDQKQLLLDLRSRGLNVIGSEHLYWANGEHEPFLRIALSRNTDYLSKGMEILREFEDSTLRNM